MGYTPPFAGSKNLRDTKTGVRIEFIVTGGYPGDGKPKPVSFPDPAKVATEIDGTQHARVYLRRVKPALLLSPRLIGGDGVAEFGELVAYEWIEAIDEVGRQA